MSDLSPGQGDFETLFRSEQRLLLALAHGLSGSRSVAEEVVQEAFLRLHENWTAVSRYERPGAWLRRVTVNLATSRLRRLRTEAKVLAKLGNRAPDPVRLSPETVDFWLAVRELPRRQAQTVALYYLEDRSVPEIADILSCAEGTVRAHLHKARTALRARLSQPEAEEI